MMKQFYQERLKRHQNNLLRYLKYVFNDHIVLFCIFLMGGFGFYYSSFVKTLSSDFTIGKPFIAIIWFLCLLTGHLATLTQEADKVFLLPKEKEMINYLNASFIHSLVLPFGFLFIVVGIAMPLLIAINHATTTDFILYTGTLWLLKASHLFMQFDNLFQNVDSKSNQKMLIFGLGSTLAIFSGILWQSCFGLVISTIMLAVFYISHKKIMTTNFLDWEKMIATEQQRMKRIYQFINLFTDVPGIVGKVKRRKSFDSLLKQIPSTHTNTYFYLYCHSFTRGSEYSGLFLRLTAIGALAMFFLTEWVLLLLIAVTFIFLIGFQLIPIYTQFDYMIMTQLYPVSTSQKKQAVKKLVTLLLLVTSCLFAFLAIFVLPTIKEGLFVTSGIVIEVAILTQLYIPNRLKKISRFK